MRGCSFAPLRAVQAECALLLRSGLKERLGRKALDDPISGSCLDHTGIGKILGKLLGGGDLDIVHRRARFPSWADLKVRDDAVETGRKRSVDDGARSLPPAMQRVRSPRRGSRRGKSRPDSAASRSAARRRSFPYPAGSRAGRRASFRSGKGTRWDPPA